MINPASLAFDFDGVIADTMALFLDIARSDYRIQDIAYEDITCYSLSSCLDIDPEILEEIAGKITDGDYDLPLKRYEGVTEVLTRLSRHQTPIFFVTARPHLGPVGDWIRENIPLAPHQVEVIATGSFDNKAQVLQEKQRTYFVEDRLETCVYLQDAGIVPILFRQPWNRQPHQFMEVGSWGELARLIDF